MDDERVNPSEELMGPSRAIAPSRPNGVDGAGLNGQLGIPLSTYEVLEELIQPKGPSLKDFVRLLKKRRKMILGTAVTVFVIGSLYALLSPDQFTAVTTVEIAGYAPVGEGELETLLQTDTRKVMYQATTTAKLTHLTLADEVLSKGDLGKEVVSYFKKERSFLATAKRWVMKNVFGIGGQDAHLDDEDPHYIHKQSFLNSYLRLLQINPVHETSLVQIRATTTDRRLSQRLANEHAEGFIQHLANERRAELTGHLDMLRTRADELQKKLSDAEAEVAHYAEQHQLVGLADGAQGNLMLSHLTELNKLLTSVQRQRVESESKVGKLEQEKSESSPLLDDETVKDLRTKLKDAESEYAALSKLVTSEYPKLVELRGKIDSLRGTIKEERQGNLSALRTQYQADLASEQLLVKQFEDQLNRAHQMSSQLVQFNLLQREASSLRDLTQSVLKALNETTMGASNAKSNVRITDYAPISRVPSAPRRNIIVVFSLLLGVIAGIGLAVLFEVLDSTIKVSDDAQAALGIPTLGIIPSFHALGAGSLIDRERGPFGRTVDKILALPWLARRRKTSPSYVDPNRPRIGDTSEPEENIVLTDDARSGAATESTPGDCESSPESTQESTQERAPEITDASVTVVVPESPLNSPHLPAAMTLGPGAVTLAESTVLDALRTLRANILFSSTQNASRVIMVASSREREGKTSVVTNLAVTFARASQRTLLIDGDFRRPKIARRFGIPGDRLGLVDFLAGQAELREIVVESPVNNLLIIPAGSPTMNPTELLGSERMASLIHRLRSEFDVILLDSAPVLPVADSLVLAQFAETVLFVVRSGRTEKPVAQDAIRRLRRVGARVRGVVLNDFDPGVGSYSSDRYTVSRYGIVEERAARAGVEPPESLANSPEDPQQAVG